MLVLTSLVNSRQKYFVFKMCKWLNLNRIIREKYDIHEQLGILDKKLKEKYENETIF